MSRNVLKEDDERFHSDGTRATRKVTDTIRKVHEMRRRTKKRRKSHFAYFEERKIL